MEKRDLINFNNLEIELINSEIELSEVCGGKNIISVVIDAVIEFFSDNDDEPTNNNCHGCTNNCK